MRIGIFDSGRGGEFVANELRQLLPEHEYIVVNDRKNVPYGSRTDEEILALTDAAIRPLLRQNCQIIVLACNTATMAAIDVLRERYPTVPFVGIEPMLKPANSLSKSRHITVLATPLTLRSRRYQKLKAMHASALRIDEPDTSGWAAAIEYDRGNTIDMHEVADSIAAGSDTIILACTHYHLLAKNIAELAPHISVLQPTRAIAQQVARVAEQLA